MVGDHSSNPRSGGAVAFVKARVVHRSRQMQRLMLMPRSRAVKDSRTARVALKGVLSRPRALCFRFRSRRSPAFFSFWFAFGFIFTLCFLLFTLGFIFTLKYSVFYLSLFCSFSFPL